MKKINIVGAGFSGLSVAYFLNQKGYDISIFEKKDKPGGMISTLKTANGLVESAANGILNTAFVENFLKNIKAEYIGSTEKSKNRFIFRGHPKKWPLTGLENLHFVYRLIRFLTLPKLDQLAKSEESITQWANRNFPLVVSNYLLGPALQGIYAGDPNQLSANLIVNPLLTQNKNKKLSPSSLLSSKDGMFSLIRQLESFLKKRGVEFHYGTPWSPDIIGDHVVIATSVSEATGLLRQLNQIEAIENATILQHIEMSSLVTATCFFERKIHKYNGFGILFPRLEKVRALGMLMNDSIFQRSSPMHSETWIFGGATDKQVLKLSDSEIRNIIQGDRELIFQIATDIKDIRVTRWPAALPHYTVQLEKNIKMLKSMKGVTLHGNYLGNIGLSRILERSALVASQIAEEVL